MAKDSMAQVRAMIALQEHVLELQRQLETLRYEVAALREMLGPERAHEFSLRVAKIRLMAESAAEKAEKELQLRQVAEETKEPKH